MPADHLNLDIVRQKLAQSQREMLVLLPNQAQNYFLSSFKKQGFDGQSWKEVKRRDPDEKAYKYPAKKGLQRRTSPILIGAGYKVRGGTLRRAVSNMARTTQTRGNGFRMIVDLPYAKIHNEGLAGKAFGKHSFDMPRRQYVGQTAELTRMQTQLITKTIDRIWKQ